MQIYVQLIGFANIFINFFSFTLNFDLKCLFVECRFTMTPNTLIYDIRRTTWNFSAIEKQYSSIIHFVLLLVQSVLRVVHFFKNGLVWRLALLLLRNTMWANILVLYILYCCNFCSHFHQSISSFLNRSWKGSQCSPIAFCSRAGIFPWS